MYAVKKKIQPWKVKEVEELTKLFREYKVFMIADLTGVPAKVLHNLRRKFLKTIKLRVSKNTLIRLAMKNAGIDSSVFEPHLKGQNILLFSRLNAFETYDQLEKNVVKDYYKPGDIVEKEVVIPEGNTGIPPGPMLSVFGKLKIPTRVEGNVIVVAKDTVVAKPGDTVSSELASLLQKLNLPLKEIKLKIKIAYDNGIVIPPDKLRIDINEYINNIVKASVEARALALEIVWPEPDIIKMALIKAYREALSLATESVFITSETIEHIVRSAHTRAYALAVELSKHGFDAGLNIPIKPIVEEKQVEKKEVKEEAKEEKKETISEETLAEGLGALFG